MKVAEYAVSIQYGEGHHFFVRTDLTSLAGAEDIAQQHVKRLSPHKKGAIPTVHIYKLERSIHIFRNQA